MNVSHVMTKGVVTVRSDESVVEALKLMLGQNISGVPVVDAGGMLAGVLTESDFMRRAELGTERRHPRWLEFLLGPGVLAGEYTSTHGRKVSEIMSQPAVTVDADAALAVAVQLMEHHRIKRLPVTCGGHLVGLLSRADLLRAFLAAVSAAEPADTSDTAIHKNILWQMDRQSWGPRATVDVLVEGGVVRLRGTVGDERTRTALKVVAENTPGVRGVEDELTTIDFRSGMVVQAAPN